MKVILITGASSGLGYSIAQYLTQKGHTVYGTSRSPQGGDTPFPMLVADVTDSASLEGAVSRILREQGKLDVLVNNAGLGMASPIETAPIADVQRLLDTNVTGLIRAVQAVVPYMRSRGQGLIINISSIGAEMGLPYRGVYSASKAAVDRITEALRTELASFGVQACSVQPGGVRTNINQNRLKVSLPEGDVYRQNFETAYALINSSVDEGLDPLVFGRLVETIVQSQKVKALYRVGSTKERLSVVLKRLLPASVFEGMIRKNYGMK